LLFFAVRTAYDDFGNLATNSTETISNPFKYVGKFGVQTDLPDLFYMRARYYLPSIGRFNQYDPIGTINPYSYVGNNPIKYIDPKGEQTIVEVGALIPMIVALLLAAYYAAGRPSKLDRFKRGPGPFGQWPCRQPNWEPPEFPTGPVGHIIIAALLKLLHEVQKFIEKLEPYENEFRDIPRAPAPKEIPWYVVV
jgi:RHS repeat-associated protein